MLRALIFLCIATSSLSAASYVSDPVKGSKTGSGSKESPWPSLQECVSSGKIRKLKSGDTLYLLSGYHGSAKISGNNDDYVHIVAAKGHTPQLSRLEINGTKWHVRGLQISPTFGGSVYEKYVVTFAEGSGSSYITVEDCFVYGVLDSSNLTVKEWKDINSGIFMGRHGSGHILRNNYVLNIRFGISMCSTDSLSEANIVENYSGDAMRMTKDGQKSQYNILKWAYATAKDGDANHDDAIQCFLFNKGKGTLRKLHIEKNIIQGHNDSVGNLAASNQAIGFFDGPLLDFTVTGNVIMTDHFHGVSLNDAERATITRNVVWSKWTSSSKRKPWIQLSTKGRTTVKDNIVTDNYAFSFRLKGKNTTEANNKPVTKEIYDIAYKELAIEIAEKFGRIHIASMRDRFTGEVVDALPEEKESKNEKKRSKK
ncbi:MAG: hypothetical protein HRU15_15030 [Planctomycetes bacterium]|nr:hypothetical protein [Planctomycetota bacterium]